MPRYPGRSAAALATAALAFGGTGLLSTAQAAPADTGVHGAAARQQAHRAAEPANTHSPDDGDLADSANQYGAERTAPAATVSGQARIAAQQHAAGMPRAGGAWAQVTNVPYQSVPAGYNDPFWGNQGEGSSLVGGRTTALAATADGTWFAGTADGGVWRSTDRGTTWTPSFDGQATLSIGALAVDPADGSVWVGTGEANTNADSYAGAGVYRSADDGATWTPVDASVPNALAGRTVFQLAFDPAGDAYAATNDGLWRMAAGSGRWIEVLAPAGAAQDPPYAQQVTSVVVVPKTHGQVIDTVIGWRSGGTPYNGFYQSTNGGTSFSPVTPTGAIDATDIGRTTFASSKDGSKLYAVVESPKLLNSGAGTTLQGVYSTTGTGGAPASLAGPWTKLADSQALANDGSALAYPSTYEPGVQSWYNQVLTVDPANANHVYLGLEEVFESVDGGAHWVTASPYWNYPFPCDKTGTCQPTTHPDQHAQMLVDGRIVIGNDGGVYSRPSNDHHQYGGWSDLNATFASWQYYDARAGAAPGSTGRPGTPLEVWGGLQDNGTSTLTTGSSQMAEPAGGDGFDVIVNPANGNEAVGEYTNGATYSTTDGGHTFNPYTSPTCSGQATVGLTPRKDCDPNARFVTPLTQDPQDTTTWLLGGEYVWISHAGWGTTCDATRCSWKQAYDTGTGNAVTALGSADGASTVYAGWVTGSGEPGPSFRVGIATNAGGTWHQLSMAGLPQRYISGLTVDPSNGMHAYVVFNAYTRQWIPGGGTGHVFETTDGGQHWTDITGNLPDIPGNALVVYHGHLVLATDLGVYSAKAGQGAATTWSVYGAGLPDAAVDDVTLGPDGRLYAATHGRGIWAIQA